MWSVVRGEGGIAGPGYKTKPVSTPVKDKGGIAGPGYKTKPAVSTPVRGKGGIAGPGYETKSVSTLTSQGFGCTCTCIKKSIPWPCKLHGHYDRY